MGGATELARRLTHATGRRVGREAVYKWGKNGVPWKWRHHLAPLAVAQGLTLPDGFLPETEAAHASLAVCDMGQDDAL